jgi:hypothetical protein
MEMKIGAKQMYKRSGALYLSIQQKKGNEEAEGVQFFHTSFHINSTMIPLSHADEDVDDDDDDDASEPAVAAAHLT